MHFYLIHFRLYILFHIVAVLPIKVQPGTCLLKIHTPQTRSSTSVTAHLPTFSRRQQPAHTLAHLSLFKHCALSHTAAAAPTSGPPATPVLSNQTPHTTSNMSVPPPFIGPSRPLQQAHIPTHILLSKPDVLFHNAAAAPTNCLRATHLLTMPIPKTRSKTSATAHLTTSVRHQQQSCEHT